MPKKNFNYYKASYVVIITSILFTTSVSHAQERLTVSATVTEKTKEFLSDPGRTGSLLGSIIAGAAVPNPLAPVLGSMAGFLIGKSSAFTNKDSNAARRQAYNNRSLVPADGVQVTGLAGLTGEPPLAAAQPSSVGMSREVGTGNQSEPTDQTLLLGASEEAGMGYQAERPEQIVIVGSLRESETGNQVEHTEQTVALGMNAKPGMGRKLQQQLAHACSNVQLTQTMSLGCYYYSE